MLPAFGILGLSLTGAYGILLLWTDAHFFYQSGTLISGSLWLVVNFIEAEFPIFILNLVHVERLHSLFILSILEEKVANGFANSFVFIWEDRASQWQN